MKTFQLLFFLIVLQSSSFLFAQPAVVQVRSEHKICKKDIDCIGVKITCSGCECYGEPVNVKYGKGYKVIRDQACKSVSPSACEKNCEENLSYFCKEGRCLLERVEEESESEEITIDPENYLDSLTERLP